MLMCLQLVKMKIAVVVTVFLAAFVEHSFGQGCNSYVSVPSAGHVNISSPNYPKYYPSNTNCYWILGAPIGSRVRCWFALIHTELLLDTVTVRDGRYSFSPRITQLSGRFNSFRSYNSSSRYLRVEFSSDSSVNNYGFLAYCEVYNRFGDALTSRCGGSLNALLLTPKYFSSPGFPFNNYPNSASCTWTIKTYSSFHISLKFLGLIVEENHDTVSVYDGTSIYSKRLVKLTGTYLRVGEILSSSNALTVQLKSDGSVNYAGFRAVYSTVLVINTLG